MELAELPFQMNKVSDGRSKRGKDKTDENKTKENQSIYKIIDTSVPQDTPVDNSEN